MGTHIDIGIVVRDIDACLPFYSEALGLQQLFDFDIPGGSHMWQLAVGECVVKLVTHASTPEAANPPGGSAGGTGLRYWTMGVDDIDAAVARCEAAGAPIPLPPLQLMPGIRIAMVEDPEGNVVEFLEQKS
ncbi:MAG TPA: VOC family protein [Acidimicrobiales bacterium]|jgi:predicted enzyme related to lactoylglutathione lyase|nr:VOC family protein [Acidimicrobiales bacterium]